MAVTRIFNKDGKDWQKLEDNKEAIIRNIGNGATQAMIMKRFEIRWRGNLDEWCRQNKVEFEGRQTF